MGTVTTTIKVGDAQGRNFREVVVEVDAGSTHTALPREMLQTLEVPVDRSVPSGLADGSVQMVEVGQVMVRLGGSQFISTVIFADEGEPSLLGVITLEDALLAVDPVNNEPIRVAAKRYQQPFTMERLDPAKKGSPGLHGEDRAVTSQCTSRRLN
jgi:predicted aspartyl protease